MSRAYHVRVKYLKPDGKPRWAWFRRIEAASEHDACEKARVKIYAHQLRHVFQIVSVEAREIECD